MSEIYCSHLRHNTISFLAVEPLTAHRKKIQSKNDLQIRVDNTGGVTTDGREQVMGGTKGVRKKLDIEMVHISKEAEQQ